MTSFSRFRILTLALGMTLLGGCSNVLTQPTPQLYVLQPKTTFDEGLPTVRSQLVVSVPDAPQSLDTIRIALAHSPTTMDYFAGSAWTDRAPVMVQELLVGSYENTGHILAVGRDTSGLRADYMLVSDLRDFEARYYEGTDRPPQVRVRLTVKLIKMPEREIIGTVDSTKAVDAEKNDLDAIVNAFADALGRAMKEVVQSTMKTMATKS